MNDIAKKALFRRCADQCDTVEMMSRDMVGYSLTRTLGCVRRRNDRRRIRQRNYRKASGN